MTEWFLKNNRRLKRIVAACTLVLILLVNANCTQGNSVFSKKATNEYLYKIAVYEQSHVENPSYGSVEGEWMMMGLARYGAVAESYIDTYKNNLKKYLKSCNGILSTRKYTEYARVIIALTSLEENPENFAGYNLLKPLAEFQKVMSQGMNGVIYTLIALDCGNYKIPEPEKSYDGNKTTREKLIGYILANQTADGGWNFAGAKADTDMTAMAIQALAPYYHKEEKVKQAVNEALNRLGELQQNDGSYCSGTLKTCESTAQVLTALSVMNVSVEDARFVKNGKTLLDGLMQYYQKNGFSHLIGGDINQMATEQAMYAMTAYYRSISGMNSLFDMADGIHRIAITIPDDSSTSGDNREQTPDGKMKEKVTNKTGQTNRNARKKSNDLTTQTSADNQKTTEMSVTDDDKNLQTARENKTKKKKKNQAGDGESEVETIITTDATGEIRVETIHEDESSTSTAGAKSKETEKKYGGWIWFSIVGIAGITAICLFKFRNRH